MKYFFLSLLLTLTAQAQNFGSGLSSPGSGTTQSNSFTPPGSGDDRFFSPDSFSTDTTVPGPNSVQNGTALDGTSFNPATGEPLTPSGVSPSGIGIGTQEPGSTLGNLNTSPNTVPQGESFDNSLIINGGGSDVRQSQEASPDQVFDTFPGQER